MDKMKIKKAITVYVPGNICNLRCSYCYITECLKNSHGTKAQFNYSVEHMIAAFAPERLGGIAYIMVIGEGETLIPPEIVPFVKGLLHQGHVVEVITNNTIDERIEELLDAPKEDLKRLIVKCSLHYVELKRLNKVESYFANIRRIIAAGASFLSVSCNLRRVYAGIRRNMRSMYAGNRRIAPMYAMRYSG